MEDRQLIHEYFERSPEALDVLFKRHFLSVYRFAYRMVGNMHDAEDVTQETFMKVWKHLKKFDESRSFTTWIFSIAKNTALDFLKKKKFVPFSAFENEEGDNAMLESIADPSALPPEIFDRADLESFLASALQKLPPLYRAVLTLRYNEGFRFREIAEVLGESIDTVKSRHRRACLMLQKLLIAQHRGLYI